VIQRESYLRELCRYVVLNPVRAGLVQAPGDWPWSSYRAVIGQGAAPGWLVVDEVLAGFGRQRRRAIEAYRRFVHEGIGRPSLRFVSMGTAKVKCSIPTEG
jgi:hypothetical protein